MNFQYLQLKLIMRNKQSGLSLFLSSSVVLMGMIVSQYSLAKKNEHSMQRNSTVPEVCRNKNAIPTIQCASTTSAHFDKHGTLWIAWYASGHVYVCPLSFDRLT